MIKNRILIGCDIINNVSQLMSSLIKVKSSYNDAFHNNRLNDEPIDVEKEPLKFVNKCLFNETETIMNASAKIMFLVFRYATSLKESPMTDEEFLSKKEKIVKDLNDDERDVIDIFGRCCFDVLSMNLEKTENKVISKKKEKTHIK